MAFTPKDWKDSPDTSTPITAAALEDLEERVTSVVFVAAPTGTAATDTETIQDALDAADAAGGGDVGLQEGTYVVTGPLVLYPLTRLVGRGKYITTIQLDDGVDDDVIQGENFETLTGNNGNAGIYGAAITDLTIDGNKANNSAGNGISIYGYDNHFENLRVTNCADFGIFHEWGDTASVSSDTLATGSMECYAQNLKIDRNDGGGIDWYGPSDSVFVGGNIAKNGPASSTTTCGVIIRGNADVCQFTNYHVWGTLHKYGWRLDTVGILTGCSAEGATGADVWLRTGGNQLNGFKFYTGGATVPYGLIVGDASGSLFSGDNVIDGKFKDCGIEFQKDSGGNVFKCSFYWADNTKTFITNTNPQNTTRPNAWNIIQQPVDGPPAAIGSLNSIARDTATVRDARAYAGQKWAVNSGFIQNIPRHALDKDQTVNSATGKMMIVGGLSVPAGRTVASVSFLGGATAYAGSAGQHMWAAMWNASSMALLAQSTDEGGSAAQAANAMKSFTFATPYTAIDDLDVYVGVCVAASSGFTAPSYWGSFVGNGYIGQQAPALSVIPTTGSLTDTAPDPLSFAGATYSTKIVYASLA